MAAEQPERPARTFHPLDTSESGSAFILHCPGGARLRLTESAKVALDMHWSGNSDAEIAARLKRDGLRPTEEPEVAGYVRALSQRVLQLEQQGEGPVEPAFGFRRVLFPAALAARIARKLTWLYGSALALTLPALCVGVWSIAHLRMPALDPRSAALGYVLFFLSLFAHEFGHSAACARFGAKPGNIGLTIYLMFPALYSDVGSCWTLPRWKRVVVDLGGAYFQGLLAVAYVGFYAWTRNASFEVAALLIAATLVFNMNPVFKFDGYWMISDALGVTNLSKQPIRLIRHALHRRRGQRVEPLPWRPGTVALLVAYSFVSIAVWLMFVINMGKAMAARALIIVQTFLPHQGRPVHYWQVAFAVFGLVMAFYLISRLSQQLFRVLHAVRGA